MANVPPKAVVAPIPFAQERALATSPPAAAVATPRWRPRPRPITNLEPQQLENALPRQSGYSGRQQTDVLEDPDDEPDTVATSCVPAACFDFLALFFGRKPGSTRRSESSYAHNDGNNPNKTAETEIRQLCETAIDLAAKKNHTWCESLDEVEVGFEMSPEFLAGTWDCLGIALNQTYGMFKQQIAVKPNAGSEAWSALDIQAWLGKGTTSVSLNKIRMVDLTVRECGFPYPFAPHDDKFKIKAFKIRGRCAGTKVRATLDYHSGSTVQEHHHSLGRVYWDAYHTETFASVPIASRDWKFHPICQTIRELRYEFQLEFQLVGSYGGLRDQGIFDTIRFDLGTEKSVFVAQAPLEGSLVSGTVNLIDLFGTMEVHLNDIKSINLIDIPAHDEGDGNDRWHFQGIKFTAICTNDYRKLELTKFATVKEQLRYSSDRKYVWSRKLFAGDWKTVPLEKTLVGTVS
ncbi:hypothetical protein RJ55_01741 [Drechmeria coniospora]|nr:hypothetical protein RJ55_01741 [Drechmeria coniospora]